MFAPLNPESSVRQRRLVMVSLALHGLSLAWLLHASQPRLLQASSIALGHNGKVLGRLYFPSQTPDASTTSSSDKATEVYRRQRLGHEKLVWKQNLTASKLSLPAPPLAPSDDNSKVATLSKLGHGAAAGVSFGVPGGPLEGDEIRPALPTAMPDPAVYPWQLPVSEGNVVIEFTIDERGEIVRTAVIESMGSELDQKALAAAANWHFRPAKQNGVAIASRQDYIFHFRARG
jgi:TonB family protein